MKMKNTHDLFPFGRFCALFSPRFCRAVFIFLFSRPFAPLSLCRFFLIFLLPFSIFLTRPAGAQPFTEQAGIALTGVDCGSVAWGDYDNDGKLDILLTGTTSISPFHPVSKIYRNNGDNTFTEQTGIVLAVVDYSSVAWGDYNNDGLLGHPVDGQLCLKNLPQ